MSENEAQDNSDLLNNALPGRVLVMVITYHAEDHIRSVFDRIPAQLFNRDDVSFICLDDASKDSSADTLAQWVQEHDVHNVKVFRNPVNQGYGGNQKLGYRYAIDEGFDFVIMLHGDGQYAPELLPQFIESWVTHDADVVLGSRMQDTQEARRGGMPAYKLLGNRVLTQFQNRMTGQNLSEFHTGYRGYSARFLKAVPFELNTNVFHYDTEILYQAFYLRAKVVEFPIPTHYGDEVCHVDGVRYARDVFAATLQYKMHQWGMLCSLKYRNLAPINYRDKTDMLYTSHTMALDRVKQATPSSVLDIGCGPGFVARRCKELGATVTGLDVHEPLDEMMDKFVCANLNDDPFPEDIFQYDAVLMLDVIEHLDEPERFLIKLRNQSESQQEAGRAPLVVLTTPNVAFWAVRLNLLLGRFNYAERGILDITHKRLFTRRSLIRALEDSGYQIESIRPVPAPFETVMSGWPGRFLTGTAHLLARIMPRMFAFQWLVTCRPNPGVRQVLAQSEAKL